MRDPSLDLLVDLARPTSDDRVLDYATGAGMAGFIVAPDVATVEAADEQPDMLEEGMRLSAELGLVNVAFTLVDLHALPYKDGTFSLVVSRNAFHLLPDPGTALAELGRVLAPGGRVVILDAVVDETTDTAFNEIARLREPAHRRHYRPDELDTIVAGAGFSVAGRGSVRSTIDLAYWLQAAAVPPPKAALIRGRFKALPVEVQMGMDVAFSDKSVSFSYDVAGLRLERV
ncbi:MAG TPA: methyltransferase domain-containing protein [Thermoleophilia bacterium]|nr:methyltransferase domain-containing protein [Thermoleophilia bacterium]